MRQFSLLWTAALVVGASSLPTPLTVPASDHRLDASTTQTGATHEVVQGSSVSSVQTTEAAADSVESTRSSSPQHRHLFGFWNMLFLLDPHECPPFGKPHDDCVRRRSADSSSGGGSSNGGSSTSSSSSYSNGGSSGTSSSSANDSANSNGSSRGLMSSTFSWLMLLAAAAAVAIAVAAVMLGQGRQVKPSHPLQGSVGRRMGLFSNFADSSLCGNTDRPQRVVEMTMSGEQGGDGTAKYSGMV